MIACIQQCVKKYYFQQNCERTHSYALDNVRGLHNLKKLINVVTKLSERRLCGVGCHSGPYDTIRYEMLFLRALEIRHELA